MFIDHHIDGALLSLSLSIMRMDVTLLGLFEVDVFKYCLELVIRIIFARKCTQNF